MVNAGILIVEQNNPTDSWMSKPLSAKMTSPGVRWSSRPLFSVRCLSLTLPPPHLYQAIWSRVSVAGTVHQPHEEMCVTQLSHWFLQTCNPSLSQTSLASSGSWSLKISGRGLALPLTAINLSQNWKCKVPMSSLVVLCKIEPYHYPLQMSPGLDCFVSAVLWEQHFSFSVFPKVLTSNISLTSFTI